MKWLWMVLLLACIAISFLIGIVCGAAGAWLLWSLPPEDPLAKLKLPPGKLAAAELQPYLDQLARDYLQQPGNVGLVIGIARGDELRTHGYGTVQRDSSGTPQEHTLFEIASVGKTLTATLLADMEARGEVGYEDAVADLLPDEVHIRETPARPITLEDLATQTSGLPSLPPNFSAGDPLNPYADYTVPQLYEGLSQVELTGETGKSYTYSNLGFGLLGHVLARRAERSFEELVVERICEPLDMHDTRMTLTAEQQARLATPHDQGRPVRVWEDTTLPGAGSFLSTSRDLLRYVRAHWQPPDGPLGDALRRTIRKRRPTDQAAVAIGLGWHITSENALDIVWHNGAAGGSCSFVGMLPEQQRGVVVLSNSSNSVDELGWQLLYLLHRHAE